MKKASVLTIASLAELLILMPVAFAQEFLTPLNDSLDQFGAIVFAFSFLLAIVMFVSVYVTTKLKKKEWRNIFVGFGLVLLLLLFANALTGGAISNFAPGLFGVVFSGITGVFIVMVAISGAEYLGERQIWKSPEKAREADIRGAEVEMQRMGAPVAAKEIAREETIEEDILNELKELVSDYKKAMREPLPVEKREEIIGMAKDTIKVLQDQEEALLLEDQIIQNAESAGKELRHDPQLAHQINTTLISICKRKIFIDEESVKIIDGLLKKDAAELEAEKIERSKTFAEGSKERKAINMMYDLHKKALKILNRIRNELLTDEKLDATNRNLSTIVESAEARVARKETGAEEKAAKAETRELGELEKDEKKEE